MLQEVKTENGPEIEFEKLVHDYGDVPYNGNGECEFRFTNTGNEPLLIQKPKSRRAMSSAGNQWNATSP